MSEKTVNDAKTGDVVTLHGTRWKVIGFTGTPCALLEREGCEDVLVNERSHHSVCLGSPHAEEFKLEDRAKKLVSEYRCVAGLQVNDIDKSDTEKVTDFARWLIDTGRIRSGE